MNMSFPAEKCASYAGGEESRDPGAPGRTAEMPQTDTAAILETVGGKEPRIPSVPSRASPYSRSPWTVTISGDTEETFDKIQHLFLIKISQQIRNKREVLTLIMNM